MMPSGAELFRPAIDQNLVSLVREYPGVTFDIVLPPISLLVLEPAPGRAQVQGAFRETLARAVRG
jgi:hypothetical protein